VGVGTFGHEQQLGRRDNVADGADQSPGRDRLPRRWLQTALSRR
jgi:hypothetical protein